MAGFVPTSRRVAVIVGILALFALANVGMARASDGAVPGDPLYGLDRAYERLADILTGPTDRAAERLAEARVLVTERGRVSDGLAHAAAALSGVRVDGIEMAMAALDRAAAEAQALESAQGYGMTEAVRSEAARLLDIAGRVVDAATSGEDPAAITQEFSQQAHVVAGKAKALGGPESGSPGDDAHGAAEEWTAETGEDAQRYPGVPPVAGSR